MLGAGQWASGVGSASARPLARVAEPAGPSTGTRAGALELLRARAEIPAGPARIHQGAGPAAPLSMSAPPEAQSPAGAERSPALPTPAEARSALEQGRIESALGAVEAARLGPPSSRALRALWLAIEQDIAAYLVELAMAAQHQGDHGAGARWLGLLLRLDPAVAERAEGSYARRLGAPQQAPGAPSKQPLNSPGRGPQLSAVPDPTPVPRQAQRGPRQPAAAPNADEASPESNTGRSTGLAKVIPPLGRSAAEAPAGPALGGARNTEPDVRRAAPAILGRLLADDIGEVLLVAAPQLWLGAGEPPGALPVQLPAAPLGAGLWIERSPDPAGPGRLSAWKRPAVHQPWRREPLQAGTTLELGPGERPWARLQPRFDPQAGEGAALLLGFERGLLAGHALGLLWLGGPAWIGRGARCLLRASSLVEEHSLELQGECLLLCGPGPLRGRNPAASALVAGQAPGAQVRLQLPFPIRERLDFELGSRRPAFWLRFEPWEVQP